MFPVSSKKGAKLSLQTQHQLKVAETIPPVHYRCTIHISYQPRAN
jgi:hypothetical protein